MSVLMSGKIGERKRGRKSETVSKKGPVVLVNFLPRYPSRRQSPVPQFPKIVQPWKIRFETHDTAVHNHRIFFYEHPISTFHNPFVVRPTLSVPNTLPFPDVPLSSAHGWMLLAIEAAAMVQIASRQDVTLDSAVSKNDFQHLITPITMSAASEALLNSTTYSRGWM